MAFDARSSLSSLYGQGVEAGLPEFLVENKRCLVLGAGQGHLIQALEKKNNKVTGIDASKTNYLHYLTNFKDCKSEFLLLDLSTERLPFQDGEFDAVYLYEVLEHLMSPLYTMLEVQRVLKQNCPFHYSFPEGTVIEGTGPGQHSYPYPGLFVYEYHRKFVNQIYFRIEDEKEVNYHIFWKMLNRKPNRPHVLDVVNGDYDSKTLYNDIETFPKIDIKKFREKFKKADK